MVLRMMVYAGLLWQTWAASRPRAGLSLLARSVPAARLPQGVVLPSQRPAPPRPGVLHQVPPFLLLVDQLERHFRNAKFLFTVRNPYAVCEGICRNYRSQFAAEGRS